MTARASGQSKPIRAARRDILAARSRAGRASATPSTTLSAPPGCARACRSAALCASQASFCAATECNLDIAEDMRVPAHHLVGDRGGDVVERKVPCFLGHAGVEDDLQQQIAELVLERVDIARSIASATS